MIFLNAYISEYDTLVLETYKPQKFIWSGFRKGDLQNILGFKSKSEMPSISYFYNYLTNYLFCAILQTTQNKINQLNKAFFPYIKRKTFCKNFNMRAKLCNCYM